MVRKGGLEPTRGVTPPDPKSETQNVELRGNVRKFNQLAGPSTDSKSEVLGSIGRQSGRHLGDTFSGSRPQRTPPDLACSTRYSPKKAPGIRFSETLGFCSSTKRRSSFFAAPIPRAAAALGEPEQIRESATPQSEIQPCPPSVQPPAARLHSQRPGYGSRRP